MARYTGPKCRLCRREGVKLFLKGARCESEKCAVTRRQQAPGQHGASKKRRRQTGSYGTQLREKQKAKRIYGILEKQFRNYVTKALKQKEVTGEALMQTLESRLDNVVYRAGFVASRAQARQLIRSGFFSVNSKVATTPSFVVLAGDIVSATNPEKVSIRESVTEPEWLKVTDKKAELLNLPSLSQLEAFNSEINPQLIVEFYSR